MAKITPKMRSIKLTKLKKLVEEIQPQVNKFAVDTFRVYGDKDATIGNCVLVNGLMHQRLLDNDFSDARFVGGKTMFSVNKADNGILDHGYADKSQSHTGGGEFGAGWHGHCWVELPKLGVIVDATTPNLKITYLNSNEIHGITDNTFLLPIKVVIEAHENLGYDQIMNGSIGYHYAKNSTDTDTARRFLNEICEVFEINL